MARRQPYLRINILAIFLPIAIIDVREPNRIYQTTYKRRHPSTSPAASRRNMPISYVNQRYNGIAPAMPYLRSRNRT